MVEAVDDGLGARDPLGRRHGDDEDEDEERGAAVVAPVEDSIVKFDWVGMRFKLEND